MSRLQAALGLELADCGPVGVGEHGARTLSAADGRRFVVKTSDAPPPAAPDAAAVNAALRERGAPVPLLVFAGHIRGEWVTVQERVDGRTPRSLATGALRQVRDLQRAQRGLAGQLPVSWPMPPWRDRLRADLTGAGHLAAEHAALAGAGDSALDLLELVAARAENATLDDARDGDVVHGDFHHGNMLVDGTGRITAVLDWDDATSGDARADLVTLLFSARTVTHDDRTAGALLDEIRSELPPDVRWLYAAHDVVRSLGWFALRHPQRDLRSWLASSRSLLDELNAP
ncbi:MAG: aminoglycoside phosphotransferase family protein [Actinomycetota bacterium]|nr:aminoglycoside phosphotransferase family protein [Actinomycetota bacterium]